MHKITDILLVLNAIIDGYCFDRLCSTNRFTRIARLKIDFVPSDEIRR